MGFGGTSQIATAGTPIALTVPDGTYTYLVQSEGAYRVSSPAPEGTITVSGANVNQPVTFIHGGTYTLTFHEVGLKVGTSWCVTDGAKVCSTTTKVTYKHLTPETTYTYAIGAFGGMTMLVKVGSAWVAESSGSVAIGAAGASVQTRFTYAVTFTETGLTAGTSWSVTAQGLTVTSTTTTVVLYLTNGTHGFTVHAVPGYSRSPATGTVSVAGAVLGRSIAFTP
ncbi:MAG: hypothetical protein WBG19_06595 [Thermoplasmata archaeon]